MIVSYCSASLNIRLSHHAPSVPNITLYYIFFHFSLMIFRLLIVNLIDLQDIYTIDESIPQTVRSYLQCMAKVTGVLLYAR